MADAYIGNYAFDCEELGVLDSVESIGLVICNVIFSFCRIVTAFFLNIFRSALQLNISELMGDRLDNVQAVLSDSLFEPLFIVSFIGVAFALLKKLALRNVTGIMADFAKVMLIIVFVALLARNTSEVLTGTTTVARDLGLSVVMEMNGRDAEDSSVSFVDETVGVLWGDLIHRPWIAMEFDGAQTDSDVYAILSLSPNSEERQNVINSYISAHPGAFSKGAVWARLAPLIIFALASLVKVIIYVACAILVLAFQLLAIFYALLGVVIMLLAMFDALGGLHLISDWLKRMLETQLMAFVTTMLLGFIVWFGGILEAFDGWLGWLGGLLFQAMVIVVLFFYRGKIFRGLVNISKNPRAAAQHLSAPSTAAFISGFRQYNQSLNGSFPQTRLDRKEQMSRIRLNEARIDYYGEERELATERIALTHGRVALTQTQQQKEELLLEHEEAKKEKRLERDAAKTQRQANRSTQDGVERPQTKQHLSETPQPEQEEPAVARPVTQEPSHAQNVQEQTPDAAQPATPHTGEGVPAYAPSSDPQNAPQEMQGKHSQEDPPVERPRTEEPTAQPLNAADSEKNESADVKENDAAASAAAAMETAQSARPHAQDVAYQGEGAKAPPRSEPPSVIERPVTQAGVVPRDMSKTELETDQERPDTVEVPNRPSIAQSMPAPVRSASEAVYAPPPPVSRTTIPEVAVEKAETVQQAEVKAIPQPVPQPKVQSAPMAQPAVQPAVQPKASSPATKQDVAATAKEAAAAARAVRKHKEAGRTVTGGNIAYSTPMSENQSDYQRPQLREALNTKEKKEGEVSSNENHD